MTDRPPAAIMADMRASLALLPALFVPLAAIACGGGTEGSSGASPLDAALEADAGDAASQADAATFDAPFDAATRRCPGASYTTAPSGATCDPNRIEHSRGLEGSCYGPGVGSTCDRLQVSVQVADQGKLPPGFVCGSPELGVVTCMWQFGDATVHAIDDAALEGACAVTAALPTASVLCIRFGS